MQTTERHDYNTQSHDHLHDIEETLLSNAVFVLKQLVTGIRSCDVSTDGLLKRRRLLKVAGVRLLLGTVQFNSTQQLPGDATERLRDPAPDKIL